MVSNVRHYQIMRWGTPRHTVAEALGAAMMVSASELDGDAGAKEWVGGFDGYGYPVVGIGKGPSDR